ncbi:MAG: glucosamine-6-phosphate deaminase [Candidatus Micrarchaeota archaeon]|nr:glucosamine-6-phosphate deaminase [Candidatus Micrarchaeota archaeon]MDE1824230.1 glucosamine-6-phosphate deaminase [Candidatus Micrarchaeota archaeon]MDE1849371.1 glucosamine-6-phosphate deaminase [Candidatus Micrarchaeota archaeon]
MGSISEGTRRVSKVDGARVLVYKDRERLFGEAAAPFLDLARNRDIRHPVVGFATGGTMVPLYKRIVSEVKANRISLRHVIPFNLDEYLGMDPRNPDSYRNYMKVNLEDLTDIRSTHLPGRDVLSFERSIKDAGGIDLQYLGIGTNGHIAFNEPGTPFDSRTHIVDLADSTIHDNAKYINNGSSPTRASTMGIGTILESRSIILIATGVAKAEIIREALEEPITEHVPASIVRMHPRATFMLDEEAASQLRH